MKKGLLFSALGVILGTSSLYAQDNHKDSYPHCFIGIQGGMNTTFYNGDHDFAPIGAFEIGNYFNPSFGLRGKFYGWKNDTDVASIQQNMEYKNMFVSVDFLTNMSNLIYPENNCPVDLVLFAGVGLYVNKVKATPLETNGPVYFEGYRKNAGLHLNAGAQLNWRLSKDFNLNLEVAGHHSGDRMGSYSYSLDDWCLTTMLGVAYKFNSHRKNSSHNSSTNAMQSYYYNQNALLADAKDPRAQARPTQEATPKPVVTPKAPVKTEVKKETIKEVKKITPTPQKAKFTESHQHVFFQLGSASLQPSEASKIAAVAKWLKENPETKVVLTGYADVETGNPTVNMKIAQKRASSIAEILTQQYGISASRISTESKGDTVQPFGENDKNRVVIAIVK